MVYGRKLVGKLDYLQNFNDYLLKCSVGKLLISCSASLVGKHNNIYDHSQLSLIIVDMLV